MGTGGKFRAFMTWQAERKTAPEVIGAGVSFGRFLSALKMDQGQSAGSGPPLNRYDTRYVRSETLTDS